MSYKKQESKIDKDLLEKKPDIKHSIIETPGKGLVFTLTIKEMDS